MTNVWLFGGIGVIVLIVNFLQVPRTIQLELSSFIPVHVFPILLHSDNIQNETGVHQIDPKTECRMVWQESLWNVDHKVAWVSEMNSSVKNSMFPVTWSVSMKESETSWEC